MRSRGVRFDLRPFRFCASQPSHASRFMPGFVSMDERVYTRRFSEMQRACSDWTLARAWSRPHGARARPHRTHNKYTSGTGLPAERWGCAHAPSSLVVSQHRSVMDVSHPCPYQRRSATTTPAATSTVATVQSMVVADGLRSTIAMSGTVCPLVSTVRVINAKKAAVAAASAMPSSPTAASNASRAALTLHASRGEVASTSPKARSADSLSGWPSKSAALLFFNHR